MKQLNRWNHMTSWSGGGGGGGVLGMVTLSWTDCVCVCAVCRIVTRQWPCTTLTERYATWSCSSTTRRWPTVNTPSSSTANQWRHTFSWASVSWNWRIMKRPSAIYREVHMGYFGNLRNTSFWDAFNSIGHPPKKRIFSSFAHCYKPGFLSFLLNTNVIIIF